MPSVKKFDFLTDSGMGFEAILSCKQSGHKLSICFPTIQNQLKSWTIQKVALQILRILAGDAHLETKRSDDSDSPLLSGLRMG
jgi:hypothetical protein